MQLALGALSCLVCQDVLPRYQREERQAEVTARFNCL
jgi:hypothetical protein